MSQNEIIRPDHVPEHAKLSSTEGTPMWVWQGARRDAAIPYRRGQPLKKLIAAIRSTLTR